MTERIVLMSPRLDVQGEGSRGGHVIGHTKSGKPIYSDPKHPSHQGFNEWEHDEAASIQGKFAYHASDASKAGKMWSDDVKKAHRARISEYRKAEKYHRQKANEIDPQHTRTSSERWHGEWAPMWKEKE